MKWIAIPIIMVSISMSAQSPQSAEYYFEKGEESLKQKSYRTALAHFNECLRINPFYYEAYYSRGLARENLGDKQGALTDFNIYLESKPEDKEALFSRAVGRYNYGQWALAKEDFIKLLKLPEGGETNTVYFQNNVSSEGKTKALTAHHGLKPILHNYLGLIETKLQEYAQAILHYDSAIHQEPENADYYLNRGLAYQLMQDTINAVKDYELVLSIDPTNNLARHNLAVFHQNQDKSRAEALLTEAIAANPTLPYSYAERGSLRMKEGNYRGALEDYNQAIKLDATEPDYWLNRGLIKEQLKDIAGALADYTQVIQLKPDYEKAWLNHGNALVKQNKFTEAIEDYTAAITYYPEYGLAYYNRSIAYYRQGKKELACTDLRRAQELGIKVDAALKTKACSHE